MKSSVQFILESERDDVKCYEVLNEEVLLSQEDKSTIGFIITKQCSLMNRNYGGTAVKYCYSNSSLEGPPCTTSPSLIQK